MNNQAARTASVVANLLSSVAALCLLGIASISAATQGEVSNFEEANRLHAQGKYAEAIARYRDILGTGKTSPAIYFNLGNAYFKAGQVGQAIAAYRQAEEIAPRDPDVQANLKFARARVQGVTFETPGWQRVMGKLSLNEWTIVASVGVWICFLLLALGQLRPSLILPLRNYLIAVAITTVLICGCLAAELHARHLPVAIVAGREAVIRQAPLTESEKVFVAHDGAEMRVLDRKGDWLQVSPVANRTGWILRDQNVLVHGG